MKNFFKKIWKAIKDFFRKVYSDTVFWLESLPASRYVYFIIGLVLTAFFAIVLPKVAEWPAVPVIALFVIIAFIKLFCGKFVNWWNYLAVGLGALVIQILSWIA